MRVLLVVEDCNPNRDSMRRVHVCPCRAVSNHSEVSMVTPIKNQDESRRLCCEWCFFGFLAMFVAYGVEIIFRN